MLTHHPDKSKVTKSALDAHSQEYFACITKAYEQLGICEKKRRAYDSVDPQFDDSIPNDKRIKASNFYEILGPIFENNARWVSSF